MKQIEKDMELVAMTFLAQKEFLSVGLTMLSMEYKFDQELPMNSVAGWEGGSTILHFSKEFNGKTIIMKKFIIAHEVLHYILLHDIRGKNKNPLIWNMAGDYMINALLMHLFRIANHNCHIDHDRLYDKKYEGWLEEEIYADLMKQAKKISSQYSPVSSPNSGNNVLEGWANDQKQTIMNSTKNGNKKRNKSKERKELNKRLLGNYTFKHHISELSKGDISNELKTILDKLTNAKVDWAEILSNSIQSVLEKSIELSWGKPRTSWLANVGQIPYLPSIDTDETFGTAIISIDESGSMSEQEVSKAISIVLQAKKYYKDILVMRHDSGEPTCKLYESKNLNVNDINYRQHSGGTSHALVFKKINQYRRHHDVSIYIGISDLESDIKENIHLIQKIPKIWLTPNNRKISDIGQIIKIR